MEEIDILARQKRYWKIRQGLTYFKKACEYIDSQKDCRSILDVGGGAAGLLFKIDSCIYQTRILLDPAHLEYIGQGMVQPTKILQEDFLAFDTEKQTYDVVACLQVLEHIPNEKKLEFARKLLQVSSKVLIVSIPYRWMGDEHHDVSEYDVQEWFGIDFESEIIKQKNEAPRMLCIFNRR